MKKYQLAFKTILLLFLTLSSSCSIGQTTKVKGKVLDESNNPIMDNSLLQHHTDSNGKATTHILNGNSCIEASIGVTNILKFFTVDLIKRLNYLDEEYEVTYLFGQRGLTVRFSAKFNF